MRAQGVWDRVAAISGVAGVVLNAVGAMLGDPYRSGLNPDPTDSSSVVAGALLQVRDDARLGAVFSLLGSFFLIWFVAYLHRHLRRYEGADEWMASAAYGGGLITVALLLVSTSITFAATEITNYGNEPVIARVFLTHGWNYFYVVSPAAMALVAASSVSALRFRSLPRWLSVLGLIMLVAPFLAGAGLGAMLGLLWMLLASAVLTVGYAPQDQPPAITS